VKQMLRLINIKKNLVCYIERFLLMQQLVKVIVLVF
jgi:hypothetical protein